MRILTVRQPWAWAIIHAGKNVENRTRNIAGAYRGTVAIHAAQGWDWDTLLPGDWTPHPTDPRLHRGAIVGVVNLVGVHQATAVLDVSYVADSDQHLTCCTSPWAELGVWHLELANPRPLTRPIPHRGGLGLRTLTAHQIATILAALAEGAPHA